VTAVDKGTPARTGTTYVSVKYDEVTTTTSTTTTTTVATTTVDPLTVRIISYGKASLTIFLTRPSFQYNDQAFYVLIS